MNFVSKYQFDSLYTAWRKHTGMHSNTSIIKSHPNYSSLVNLGFGSLPHIAETLSTQENSMKDFMLVELAEAITGVYVHITEEDCGKTDVICNSWFKWWEEHKDEYQE